MSKLEDYYRLFDMFKGNLTDAQKEVLGQLEDQIIAEEILPAISESVAPVLKQLRRNLTLIVDYDTEHGVSVKTTRGEVVVKENTTRRYEIPSTGKTIDTSIAQDSEDEDDEEVDEVNAEGEKAVITRSESIGFTVTFRDGSIVVGKDAQATLVETLRKIGLQRVSKYNKRTFKGYALVGKVRRTDGGNYCQKLVDGWYVYVHMSNDVKIKLLNDISDEFDLGLVIKNENDQVVEPVKIEETHLDKKAKRQLYSFEGGQPHNKRRIVRQVVTRYLAEHPTTTYDELCSVFPKNLQGSYAVFRPISYIEQMDKDGYDHMNRYFTDPDDLLSTADNVQIAVSTQWGNNFENFVKRTAELGWQIVEVK